VIIFTTVALSKEHKTIERRSSRRYPVDGVLEYRVVDEKSVVRTGNGRLLNISNDGVLFQADGNLTNGLEVELLIEWPTLTRNSGTLEFHALGHIVRSQESWCAISILRSDFRPQYRAGTSVVLSSGRSERG